MAEGVTSFEDWPMLKWLLGWTGSLVPSSAPIIFMAPSACTKRRGLRRSLMGKLSRARRVCAPKRASLGTWTSPIESRSTRCGVSCLVMVPPIEARTFRAYNLDLDQTHYTRGDPLE